MSRIICSILLLISFINITLSQSTATYDDAICNGENIQAFPDGVNYIQSITQIPDNPTFGATDNIYTISNPPTANPDETALFFVSAVDPISGQIFVLLKVKNDVNSGASYIGTLNTDTQQVTIIYPSFTALDITSITFDCKGNLYAFDRDLNTHKVDINDINETNVTLIDDGTINNRIKCEQQVDCDSDIISYHWEQEKLYRISSIATDNSHLLFVRDAISNGIETQYTITDPNNLCFNTNPSGAIGDAQYIGNNLFLLSCFGTPFSIRLLDVSDINTPEVVDIGNDQIENQNAVSVWYRALIPGDTNGNVCIPPATCTPSPTQSPTTTICEDKCDAFSVIVDDYNDIQNDIICIDYTVTRLSDKYPDCHKDIKYFILGLCDDDLGMDIDSEDLHGIIQSFDIISNNRRVLGSDSSDDYRRVSGSTNGIIINVPVSNELKFTLCMTNIFDEPIEFSNVIGFRRGRDKFVCNDNDNIFDGLPCINKTKFNPDSYDSSGYNKRFKKVNKGGKKRKSFSSSGERALINEELENNNNWGVLSELDPYVRWTLISIFIVSGVLIIIGAYICICRKGKKVNDTDGIQNELGTVIKENRDVKTTNTNTNNTVSSDDEIVIENE